MRSEIKRWGNSAAIRLPRGILAEARLELNSPVTVVVDGRKIIIEATGEPLKKHLALPFSEADLIRGLNPDTAHADELARPGGAEIGDE
jgi:antitoxin MazE